MDTNIGGSAPRLTPIAWRNFAARVCGNGMANRLGQSGYRFAAKRSAEVLFTTAGVRSVALRGGALDGPVPGVSDIDLTIFLEQGVNSADYATLLTALGRQYCRLKKPFPMLGEILVLSAEDRRLLETSGNSLVTQTTFQKLLCGRPIEIKPTQQVSFRRQFAVGERYYREMLAAFHAINQDQFVDFHRARCLRFARKIERLSNSARSTVEPNAPLSVIFARAFRTLHLIATRAIDEPNLGNQMKELRIIWRDERSGLGHPQDKGRSVWWMLANEALRKSGRVLCTDELSVFLWDGDQDPATLEALFDFYSRRIGTHPGLPILMSPPMAECRLLGATDESPYLNVERIPPERQRDSHWMKRLNYFLYEKIEDRFLVNYFMLPFNLMASPLEVIRRQIEETCGLAMSLTTARLAPSYLDLRNEARESLPLTCDLLDKVTNATPVDFGKSFLRQVMLTRREMGQLFEAKQRALK